MDVDSSLIQGRQSIQVIKQEWRWVDTKNLFSFIGTSLTRRHPLYDLTVLALSPAVEKACLCCY